MGDPYIFAPTDPGTWIRSVDGTWRRAPDAAALPPAALAAVERAPDLVRALEENNERPIAFLEEHLPARGDWQPTIGDAVEAMNAARAGQKGIVARNQGGRLPWVVLSPDGCETGYAAHEIRPWPAAAASLVARGTFRVYFNRHGAAPLVWCVAPVLLGDHAGWELAVASVSIRTLVGTVHQPKATPDDEDGRPSAWIVATGVLTVRDGDAVIDSDETPEVQIP